MRHRLLMEWGVVNSDGEVTAQFHYAEDAAAFVGVLGAGSNIIHLDSDVVVWAEGSESQSAADSYDYVRNVCNQRWRDARKLEAKAKGLGMSRR